MEISNTSIVASTLFKPGDCSDCSSKTSLENKQEIKDAEKSQHSNEKVYENEDAVTGEKPANKNSANPEDRLTEEQLKQLDELKQRDQEVRMHEAAHLAAAGQHAKGGPTFDYQQGPDGKRYAVGGEVSIDTSKIPNDPEATIQKARQIRAAAMAPAEPSSQDRQVAAQAVQMEAQARAEIQEQQTEESKTKSSNNHTNDENSEQGNEAQKSSPASAYESVAGFDPNKNLNIFEFVV